MKILIFLVSLHTLMCFGNIPAGMLNRRNCSSQASNLPCVAYRLEGEVCTSLPVKYPELYKGPWHVDGPSEIMTEHFCKEDENDNNVPGMRIRWKLPDHSGMRDLKGFEIMIDSATSICIVIDLSNANITMDFFQYGDLEFEQTVHPIEVGSLYIVTIHSLPKKVIYDQKRTQFSSSITCKDASPATWVASLKIKTDFMNRTIFVTFNLPPSSYEFTSFTYQLRRQIGNNVSIEERRLNLNYCMFGNLTSTEKYEVMVQPYDPFWNDRQRCKCKNFAQVCETCTWTRTGTFTLDDPRVRRNKVSELANNITSYKHDSKTNAIIISSVLPVGILSVLIIIIWKIGGFRRTPCFDTSCQGIVPLDLKRKSDKDSNTKKFICLIVNGEMEDYVCLLPSLQYLIQSTGRCITWVLDCSLSSVQKMIDDKNVDSIVLVTIPVYPKSDDVNYTGSGHKCLECIQLAHEESAKGNVFREKLVRIIFHDVTSRGNQFSYFRQFQLPNELIPFLIDIGCFQAKMTNDSELHRYMSMNQDFREAFYSLVSSCQTITSNTCVDNSNTPGAENCKCNIRSQDYQRKMKLELMSTLCPHDKYGTTPDGINKDGNDLSKNVSFPNYFSQKTVQSLEDWKKAKSKDGYCSFLTQEKMLKSTLSLSYGNDTQVIRKKCNPATSVEDQGFSMVDHDGELKQKQSASFNSKIMGTFLDQNKLKVIWDGNSEEDGCVTDEVTVPDSGFFEYISLTGAQFLGVSDINVAENDETDLDDIISRDMYLINRHYDDIVNQLNKGETVSISANCV